MGGNSITMKNKTTWKQELIQALEVYGLAWKDLVYISCELYMLEIGFDRQYSQFNPPEFIAFTQDFIFANIRECAGGILILPRCIEMAKQIFEDLPS